MAAAAAAAAAEEEEEEEEEVGEVGEVEVGGRGEVEGGLTLALFFVFVFVFFLFLFRIFKFVLAAETQPTVVSLRCAQPQIPLEKRRDLGEISQPWEKSSSWNMELGRSDVCPT